MRSPGRAAVRAALAFSILALPAIARANLLNNPDAELNSISGWTVSSPPVGNAFTVFHNGQVPPHLVHGGHVAFWAGKSHSRINDLHQDVDVSSNAADIDAGAVQVIFSGWAQSSEDRLPTGAPVLSTADIGIEFLDGSLALVANGFHSGAVPSPNTWQHLSDQRLVPPNTRVIRLHLHGVRLGGAVTNAFFDDLDLSLQVSGRPAESAMFEYAVKFMCGKSTGQLMAPGRYFTTINVHNPSSSVASFRKKFAAVGERAEVGGKISEFVSARLRPDQVFEIDCEDISSHIIAPTAPNDGFVVIQSPTELDVVAVYTTVGASPTIQTMEMERVPARRFASGGLPDLVPVPGDQGDFCRKDAAGNLIVTVHNQGAGPSAGCTTTVQFGNTSVSRPTPPLLPGESKDLFFPIPSGTTTDTFFKITVDSGSVVPESNEANNTANGTCIG